jgi:DNA-binding beta-propeller fold protein YncE
MMGERRVPCAYCKATIVEGAKKCPTCKAWQPDAVGPGPRFPRAAIIMVSAVATVMSVLVTARESPVGEAPPLTALADDPAGASSQAAPSAPGAAAREVPTPAKVDDSKTKLWKTRELLVGDARPLDVVWNPDGKSIYVSADDATLREYRVDTGEMLHKASVPARGDRIRLLFGRYVALLRAHPGVTRLPVMDTTRWDRDPIVLSVGRGPGDIAELPDGESVVTATTDGQRVSRFGLPSGRLLADITLPQSTGQLFAVTAEGRTYLAALGSLSYGSRPAGAWVDLFDPSETPFGATRRSIPVGRDPGVGSVSTDGGAIFFPDRASNRVSLIDVGRRTDARSTTVGQRPVAAFMMADDAYGLTLNAGERTASVVELEDMEVVGTLMLSGVPRAGALSPDRRTLFVSLGGEGFPPRDDGVVVIAGSPPEVVATLPTGAGAGGVAVAGSGLRAVVPNFIGKSLTVIE